MAATSQVIKIAVNPWLGSNLDAQVAKILLEEKLGYSVELVPIDETAQFSSLATGDLSATLEVWPSGHAQDHLTYIEQQKTVEDLGPLGVVGKIGWYVPTYLVQSNASLATWEGIKTNADLFRTADTGVKGQLLEGDPTWSYHDQQIIDTLNLNLKIVQAGSESNLISAIDSAVTRKDPLLFYLWTPHSILGKYPFTEVQLPVYFDGCTGCGYPSDPLYKAASAGLRETAPAAYRFLSKLQLSNADQIAMMTAVDLNGQGPADAARAWVNQNQAKWSGWLRESNSALPAIPAPATIWAAKYLYVLDKDTNGVFLNANNLFIQSLIPIFPQIHSAADLMGKDDFYFYPVDLANKFRADDRKVMDSGVSLTTVEPNQPAGGVRTIVSVTKVPLRDEYGRVIGLRAVWHSHPQLEVTNSLSDIKISYPADASSFRLERNDDLLATNAWVPQFIFTDPVGGKLTLKVPASEAPSYFRLRLNHPVKIGALLSLTGDWSTLGQNVKSAMEVGLSAINLEELSRGSGLSFTSDIRDTKLDPATALSALQSLAARGIKIVIGPQSSSEAALLKPFADANGILLISPGSTASSLSIPGDNLYRFCPDDTYEAKAMVALLKADDIGAIVPIWRDDAGNQGLRNSMNLYFPQEGGAVSVGVKYSASQHEFGAEISDLTAQVLEAQKTHPDKVAVYLAAFDEVVELFNEARTNATLASVKWYGSDGVVQSQVLATNKVAAEFAAQHGYPCPTFGLDDRYIATWGPLSIAIKSRSGNDVDAFALAGYDALRVSALAYRTAGAEAQFADIKSAFLQSAASYSGATGPTLLNAAGDRDGGAFDFWSLKANGDSFIWYRSVSFEPTPTGGSIIRFP